jgi:hypothetical protein
MSGSEFTTHPAYRAAPSWDGPSRPGKGLSLAGLAVRQLRLRGGWTASLALGLTFAFAIAALAPVAGAMAADAALHAAVTGPAGRAPLTVAQQKVPDQAAFEATQAQMASTVQGRLGPYLASSSALATLGPLTPVSLNENPAPAQVDSSRLAVGYLRDLAEHVELVAGAVPPDGLGGSADIAATMAQTEADALGLHLGDRLCIDFAAGGTRWCARVAGLWRPLEGGDPFRLEAARQVELVVGRYDFYRLMKLAAAPVATVGRQFYVDVNALDSRDAGDLVSGLRELRKYFTSRGTLFDTSLDRVIESFGAEEGQVRVALALLGGALAVLVLFGAAFLAGHFLRLQSREVTLVRARGWPRRRVKRLLMLQLSLLVFVGLVVGAGLAAAAAAVFGPSLFGVPPPWPDVLDGAGAVVPLVAVLTGLALLWLSLSTLAGRAANGVRPGDAVATRGFAGRPGPRAALSSLGLVVGLVLLAAVRLPQGPVPPWLPRLPTSAGGALDWLTAAMSLLALLLLAAAATQTLPLSGRLAGGLRHRVSNSLARWQLARRPWQHSQIAFLLTVAVAVGTFAALAALNQSRRPQPPAAAVLIGGSFSALLIALFAFAFHFRAVAGERAEEYASLLLSGLPARALRSSLAVEQRAVTWHGLGWGAICAAALSLTLLPLGGLTADPAAAGAVFVGVLLAFLAVLLVAGWATRAWLGRLAPGNQLGVLL